MAPQTSVEGCALAGHRCFTWSGDPPDLADHPSSEAHRYGVVFPARGWVASEAALSVQGHPARWPVSVSHWTKPAMRLRKGGSPRPERAYLRSTLRPFGVRAPLHAGWAGAAAGVSVPDRMLRREPTGHGGKSTVVLAGRRRSPACGYSPFHVKRRARKTAACSRYAWLSSRSGWFECRAVVGAIVWTLVAPSRGRVSPRARRRADGLRAPRRPPVVTHDVPQSGVRRRLKHQARRFRSDTVALDCHENGLRGA
jgi:hypothetical protein